MHSPGAQQQAGSSTSDSMIAPISCLLICSGCQQTGRCATVLFTHLVLLCLNNVFTLSSLHYLNQTSNVMAGRGTEHKLQIVCSNVSTMSSLLWSSTHWLSDCKALPVGPLHQSLPLFSEASVGFKKSGTTIRVIANLHFETMLSTPFARMHDTRCLPECITKDV